MQSKGMYTGHLAMLGANLLWGVMSPLSKAVLQSGLVGPLSLTTLRMVGAAAAFWILSLFTRREHVTPHDLALLFFASLFGVTLNQGFFITGVSLTSPIDASVVTTTTPIITMILAALYLKEPITSKKVMGIFMGAVGALILILSADAAHTGENAGGMTGNILCLMAELCFATYCVVFKDLIGRYSPVTLMKWMFTYAAICCIPFSYNGLASINFTTLPTAVYADLARPSSRTCWYPSDNTGFARRSSRCIAICNPSSHRCSPYCGEWTGSRRPRERRSCWFSWESTWSTAVNRGPRWKPKRSKPHAVPLRMRLLRPTESSGRS